MSLGEPEILIGLKQLCVFTVPVKVRLLHPQFAWLAKTLSCLHLLPQVDCTVYFNHLLVHGSVEPVVRGELK